MSDKFTGAGDDFTQGVPPLGPGLVLDVDGDGDETATVRGGVWTSKNQALADYLNTRAEALGIRADDTLLADAKQLMGIGD